jgi:general stress protein 26
MTEQSPRTTLDTRYSDARAEATPWPDARAKLEQAELFWVSTIRPNGRLHVTPVVGVWMDGAFYFCSGAEERKSKNISANPHCAVTTGCNAWADGFDIVLHSEAVVVLDPALLQRIADTFRDKYGERWAFKLSQDGTFNGPGGAVVYEVAPTEAWGFSKGEPFGHTRWDFDAV